MELIQNWDNQDQQAKSFQMRYNLSKFNNWNYQTLRFSRFWSGVSSELCLYTYLPDSLPEDTASHDEWLQSPPYLKVKLVLDWVTTFISESGYI